MPNPAPRTEDGTHTLTPRSQRLRVIATAAVLGCAGLLFGLQLGQWEKHAAPPGQSSLALDVWEKLGVFAMCIAAIHFVLLAHELGHLLGGRAVGFRAFLLIVGPLRLERRGEGWQLLGNWNAGLWGGLAGSAATDSRDLRRRTAVMVGSGPAASLLLGVAGLAAWWAMAPTTLSGSTPYGRVLSSFALLAVGGTSLAIALATLIPMQTSGFLSDGARLLRLARGGPVAARDMALQTLIGQSLGGTRPRDWEPELLVSARAVRDGTLFELTAWQLAQLHAADTGYKDEAQHWLSLVVQHIDRFPKALQVGVQLDAARQLALSGDVAQAKSLIDAATGPAIGAPWARPLARAAVLSTEGRHRDAMALLPDIRHALAQSIDRGGAKALADSVALIESRARDTSACNEPAMDLRRAHRDKKDDHQRRPDEAGSEKRID